MKGLSRPVSDVPHPSISQNEQPHPVWYPLGQPESQNKDNLKQGSVNVSCKGSHSTYFRLCGPYTVSQLLNSANVKKQSDNTQVNGQGCLQVKLYLQKQADLPVINPCPRERKVVWDIEILGLLLYGNLTYPDNRNWLFSKSLKYWTLAWLAGIQDTAIGRWKK